MTCFVSYETGTLSDVFQIKGNVAARIRAGAHWRIGPSCGLESTKEARPNIIRAEGEKWLSPYVKIARVRRLIYRDIGGSSLSPPEVTMANPRSDC